MKIIVKILLSSLVVLLSPLINLSFADDDVVKFKLEIKPNQQKAEAKIDGNEHKQIQIRAEYIKLNTVTNNYHIKVTIINNSGQILYHQLALIDKVEHSGVKYPDSTTDYMKYDDGKQVTKTLPYYNYGNIKPNQATPREWYLSNTGKDEIEIEGYLISKEIPIVIDITKITDPGVCATLTKFFTGLRDNDLDMTLSAIAPPDIYLPRDLHKPLITSYNDTSEYFLILFLCYKDIKNVGVSTNGNQWIINSWWIRQDIGTMRGSILVIENLGNQVGWLITEY